MILQVEEIPLNDVFADIVRVHHSHRPNIRAGQVVKVSYASKTLYAVARGSLKNRTGVVQMDQALRTKLGVRVGQKADIQFTTAGFFDEWIWAFNTTDAMPRFAARISIISLFLGIVGLGLGVMSVWPSSAVH